MLLNQEFDDLSKAKSHIILEITAELLIFLEDIVTYSSSLWLFKIIAVPTDTTRNTADIIDVPADTFCIIEAIFSLSVIAS